MRLLLAATEPDLRLSLQLLLGEQPGVVIVGTASEGDGLLALMRTSRPQMIVTEWDLPGHPLPALIAEAHYLQPFPASVMLMAGEANYAAAENSGADAVVLTGASPEFLISAFHRLQRQLSPREENNKYESS